jgi:tetratricopeptide (TPR) repeat protein
MCAVAVPETPDRFDRMAEIEVSLDAFWLGKCAEAFGDPELALAYYRRALAVASAPRDITRRRATLGAALARQGALDEALAVLHESIELDPSFDTNRESFTALVEVRQRRGELRKAHDLARAMAATLADDERFGAVYEALLAAVDGRKSATAPRGSADPFAAVLARVASARSEAQTLERHLRLLGD